eukprot:12071561-Heterocapsa_arctica.AAC.1
MLIEGEEPENSEEFKKMCEKVKRELKGRGIPVHKEASSNVMEKGLGMTSTLYPHVLKVCSAKLKDMVLATEAVVREDW